MCLSLDQCQINFVWLEIQMSAATQSLSAYMRCMRIILLIDFIQIERVNLFNVYST